jgi:DNA-binding NarL/FixJ family response regulator
MRILLADEQPKVRFAIHVLLGPRAELEVVGEATDAEELLAQLTMSDPDVVILDWRLPGLEEVGSITTLKKNSPGIYVIVLSGRPELGQAALDAGADEFVSKIDPPEHLLSSMDRCQAYLNHKQAKMTIH